MNIRNFLLKIAGKNALDIDNNISNGYISRLCFVYGCNLVRGFLFSLTSRKIASKIFIGKRVKILEKKRIMIGKNTKIHDNVYIDCLSNEGVKIENNVIIGRNTRIECTGSISQIGRGLLIEEGTTFGNDCYFGAAGGIKIGKNNICGQYIRFHSENHNYNDKNILIKDQGVNHKGIKIGDNNWIGAGVVFLDGAEIGNGCVVAANAVITKKFKDNVIIGGVPAKIISVRGENCE